MKLKTVNGFNKDMTKKPDDSKTRNGRKVRFELPKSSSIDSSNDGWSYGSGSVMRRQTLPFDQHPKPFHKQTKPMETKVHGTANYVNGTLNFSTYDFGASSKRPIVLSRPKIQPESKPIIFRNELTNDASAKNARKNCSIDQQYWDNAVRKRGILIHVSADNQQSNHIKFRKNKIRRYTSIFMKPAHYLKRSQNRLFASTKATTSTPNTLELPTHDQLNKTPKTNLKTNAFEKFSYKLISIKKPTTKKRTQVNGDEPPASDDFDARALSIVQNAFYNQPDELEHQCTSKNLSEILQMAHRWQSTTQSLPTSDNVPTTESSTSVELCTLKKLDVKQ